jgi:hypothetical protein
LITNIISSDIDGFIVSYNLFLKHWSNRTSDNTEDVIKKVQSRETGNIGHTKRRKTKENITQYNLDTTIRTHTQIT